MMTTHDAKMTVVQEIRAGKCKQREEVTMGEYIHEHGFYLGFRGGSRASLESCCEHTYQGVGTSRHDADAPRGDSLLENEQALLGPRPCIGGLRHAGTAH